MISQERSMNKSLACGALVLAALLTGCGQNTPSSPPEGTGQAQAAVQLGYQQNTTTTPSPEATQEAVPEELDQPAQEYEAKPGESLQSGATVGNVSPATMLDYLGAALQDVHGYWSGVLTGAGYPAPAVDYYFPVPGESYPTKCSPSDDTSMFYCSLDDTIVFSQAIAAEVWNGQVKANQDPETGIASGDFSVAYLVAHEYAHNVQTELGLIGDTEEELMNPPYPVYKTELHADCWAGVWANSAYYKGYLEGSDVEEAQQATRLIGDYQFANPKHHGTPQQRLDAFTMGYNSGAPSSCDPWLLNDYE
jgi:uncharacterized protein